MGIPYVIVKGKARLGTVVHKKTSAVIALQEVKSEDQRDLATIISAAKANLYVTMFSLFDFYVVVFFLFANGFFYSSDKYDEQRRVWGGGIRGNKSTQMLRKRAKASGIAVSAASLGKL